MLLGVRHMIILTWECASMFLLRIAVIHKSLQVKNKAKKDFFVFIVTTHIPWQITINLCGHVIYVSDIISTSSV